MSEFSQIAKAAYGARQAAAAPAPRAEAGAGAASRTASAATSFTGENARASFGVADGVDDVANFLPESSQEILRSLEYRHRAAWVTWRDLSDQRQGLVDDRDRLQGSLRTLGDRKSEPGNQAAIDDRNARIAALNASIARIDAQRALYERQFQPAGTLVNRLKKFVMGCVSPEEVVLPAAVLPEVAPKRGEQLTDAVETRRRRVRELLADRERAKAAPITSDRAKALALAEIEERAERARPDCMNLIEYGEPIEWGKQPVEQIISARTGTPNVFAKVPDAIGLLALMFKDDLVRVVNAEIDAASNDEAALSDEQRAETISACGRDLYAAQLEEEALIRAAALQGIEIARRADADPRAVLGLSAELPEPTK